MVEDDSYPSTSSDITPAVPLEISAEMAAAVDELLRDFAEGAELETALVVERSGALVSGISAEAEVKVDVISALVAGASAAMNTLVKELGGSGNIESFHQSEERAVYLAEILDRFVLVGVSTVPVPVGVIREKARRIRPSLLELLQDIHAVIPVPPAKALPAYSLRDMALKQASELAPPPPEADLPEPMTGEATVTGEEIPPGQNPPEEIPPREEGMEGEREEEAVAVEIPLPEEEPEAPAEPTEIIETLDDGSPEIVIEDASGSVIDSPFETEEDFEIEEPVTDSIFELEEDGEEKDEPVVPEPETAPVFEIAEDDEEEEMIFEADEEATGANPAESIPIFEMDEDADEEEGDAETFELDLDDFEEDPEDSPEGQRESIEEEETSGSGPLYF